MAEPVYKVLSAAAFAEAARAGYFTGSPDDTRDGFIHLSAAQQLEGTLAKHFAGQDGLVLLALDPDRLGSALKWEVSRGGELFAVGVGVFDEHAALADVDGDRLDARDGLERFLEMGGEVGAEFVQLDAVGGHGGRAVEGGGGEG